MIRRYAEEVLPQIPDLQAKLLGLRGKRLGCHCAPKRCHGDAIARALRMAIMRAAVAAVKPATDIVNPISGPPPAQKPVLGWTALARALEDPAYQARALQAAQENGIVSDQVTCWAEVAESDRTAVITFLHANPI